MAERPPLVVVAYRVPPPDIPDPGEPSTCWTVGWLLPCPGCKSCGPADTDNLMLAPSYYPNPGSCAGGSRKIPRKNVLGVRRLQVEENHA